MKLLVHRHADLFFMVALLSVVGFYGGSRSKKIIMLALNKMFLSLVLSVILMRSAFAVECPSRHYCHTAEVKYRSFNELPGAYLNSTSHLLKTFSANTSRNCMQECTRTENCQSANYYTAANASEMSCDLIDGNKWSNASLLVKRENSTHFFIKSPCSSNPCKNGGTCISLDQAASYKCACANSNYTTTILGSNCEILIVAEKNADAFYNFDQNRPIDVNNPTSYTMYPQGTAKPLHVTDRKDPVFYLEGISSSYIYSNGLRSNCPVTISCSLGLTVSLWFRMLKRSQSKFSPSSCASVKIPLMFTNDGTSYDTYRGFRILLTGCQTNAIEVHVRGSSQYHRTSWGNASDPAWYKSWSHIAFVKDTGNILRLYFNGKQVTHVNYASAATVSSIYTNGPYFGYRAYGGIETYIDDASLWSKGLTPEDIAFLYQKGLERQKIN